MAAKYTLLVNKETQERSIRINSTGERIFESQEPDRYRELRKRALRNAQSRARDDIMSSLGLTKVRGAVSGRTYWE